MKLQAALVLLTTAATASADKANKVAPTRKLSKGTGKGSKGSSSAPPLDFTPEDGAGYLELYHALYSDGFIGDGSTSSPNYNFPGGSLNNADCINLGAYPLFSFTPNDGGDTESLGCARRSDVDLDILDAKCASFSGPSPVEACRDLGGKKRSGLVLVVNPRGFSPIVVSPDRPNVYCCDAFAEQ